MVDTTKSFTKQVLDLTNDFRKKNGLDPLKWDPELATAAQKHSDNMGRQDFFSHQGKDGSQPWDRTKAAGDDNNRVGENIAAGQRTPEEVVQGWINSPGHRANMLNPKYEYLGVGYHEEKSDKGRVNYRHYWTQNFGGGGTPPSGSNSENSNQGSGNNNSGGNSNNNSGNNSENNFENNSENNSGSNPGNNPEENKNPNAGMGNNNSPSNSNNDFTKQVLELTNDFREKNGLDPLKWDPELATAAQKHSDNMGRQDFFSHQGKDGSQPWDRTKAAGDDNNRVGENIAAGQRTPEEVVQGWINSPGHRANMLNPKYEYLGVGYHEEKPDKGNVNYQHYWTQNFGGGGTPPGKSNLKNESFGVDETLESGAQGDKDMLMGTSKNESLAGDFGNNKIQMNDITSGNMKNYNPEFIWGRDSIDAQNFQNQNLQNQNLQNQNESMLPDDLSYDGLGTGQFSQDDWMGLKDSFLEELHQGKGHKFVHFGKHCGGGAHLFG